MLENNFYIVEESEPNTFSEEMEADVFPEMSNKEIIVGTNLETETDYSNYEPPEDSDDNEHYEEEENPYADLYKVNRKEKKRNNKKQQQARTKKYSADDMSDY